MMTLTRPGPVLATLLVVAGQPACKGSPAAPPPVCDLAGLRKADQALEKVDRRQRSALAAAGLAEACPALPTAASRVLDALANGGDPAHMFAVVAQGVAGNVAVWNVACPGGTRAFESVAASPPEDKSKALLAACKLERGTAFATRAELEAAPNPRLLAALVIHQLLRDGNVEAGSARKLARALLGL
ncbi:MAG: hypothetical protein HYY84_15730 [Deltaproteobacteria bacterium]|nr:hypothetical protein [Deltaproteobacteria bacterium]